MHNNVSGSSFTHGSEAVCFSAEQHVRVMNAVNGLSNGAVNAVIVTSEDKAMLQKIYSLMANPNVSEVEGWTIVRNVGDVSAGEGTTTYKDTVDKFQAVVDPNFMTSLENDQIVNAVATLLLHLVLEPEYHIFWDQTSFHKFIWLWASNLDCTSLSIRPELQHRSENRKCIELKSQGGRKGPSSYDIIWPPDLRPSSDERKENHHYLLQRFGLNLTGSSWQLFCGQGLEDIHLFRH